MDHGVFSRLQLLHGGWDDWTIRKRVADGDLTRLRRGWFATTYADERVARAVRSGGALSCASALQVYGYWVPPGYENLHVRSSRNLTRGHSCRLPGTQLPVRVALDPVPVALACAFNCMPAEHWIAACDSVMNTEKISGERLRADLGTVTRAMDELLEQTDGRAQSGTESITRIRLRAEKFDVHVQPQIAFVGRSDLRIGSLILECDSKTHHTSLADYQNDRRRDRKSLRNGWMTMRITYNDVLYGWDEVLDDIRAVTRARRHRIRGTQRPTGT